MVASAVYAGGDLPRCGLVCSIFLAGAEMFYSICRSKQTNRPLRYPLRSVPQVGKRP